LIPAVSAFDALVIKVRYWGTDSKVDEECGYPPADGVGHVGPGEHFELAGREEAHVEEQDRGFDANQGWRIGPLHGELDLESC
jgi:hypothetical protein